MATHARANRQRKPDFSTTTFAPLTRVHPFRLRRHSPRIFVHSLFVHSQVVKTDGLSATWALCLTRLFLLFCEPLKHAASVENVLARQLHFALPIPNPCFHANNTSLTPKIFGANGRRIGTNACRSGAYDCRSGLGRQWRRTRWRGDTGGGYAGSGGRHGKDWRSGLGRRWRRTRWRGGGGNGGSGGRYGEAPALGSLHAPGLSLLVARVLAVPLPTPGAITVFFLVVPGTFGVQVAVRSGLCE